MQEGEQATWSREKTCKNCAETLPLSEFNRNSASLDGHENKCRECRRRERRAWRAANPGKERKATRLWYEANKEQQIQRITQWKRDHPERVAAYARRNYTQYPDKHKARTLVASKAIAAGDLNRPEHCTHCHSKGNIQAHHHDYSKPLDVEWLCTRCHGEEHCEQPRPVGRTK